MKKSYPIYLIVFILFLSCDPEKLFRKAPVIDNLTVSKDQVIPFDTVFAEVQASNPEEGALSYHWTVSPDQGTFLDPIDGKSVRWVAPINGGDYTFKVEVMNEYKSAEKTKIVKVVSQSTPFVRIQIPATGDYWVQLTESMVEVEAFHTNGINKVALFVNDEVKKEQGGHSDNNYQFFFTPDTTMIGRTEIKIQAVANLVSTIDKDSVYVTVEGILPGK